MDAVIINIEDSDRASCGVDGDYYYVLRLYPGLLPCARKDALVDEHCRLGFFGVIVVHGG